MNLVSWQPKKQERKQNKRKPRKKKAELEEFIRRPSANAKTSPNFVKK
jgi:hypothetical protein